VYKRGYRFTIPITLPSPPLRLEQARPVAYENLRVLTVSPPRLAILPLLSGPDVPPALGVEIAESTIQRLSRMRVPIALLMARDSVFAMAAEGATALQTGTALKAQLALAGSITALPTHLRIRVEMIRVADGVQLWIDDFLVPRAGISVETEAARRVAIAIRSRAAMHSGLDDAPEIDSEEMIRRRA
jgi:TolB-like protein